MSSTFMQRRRAEGSSRRPPPPTQSRRTEEDSLDLPPYEPPRCPLTDKAQAALRELSASRTNEKYKKGLDESAQLLSKSVESVNAAVERAEGAVEGLGGEVESLTARVEEAVREVIDMQAALQDEKGILGDLPGLVAEKQQIVAGQIPGVPVLDVLQEAREAKAAEYERLRPYEKYALNNTYIDFKRSWHQGVYPDEEIPVPDATKWFDREGRPRHITREERRQSGEEDGEGESDDDIQIAREKRSFKCPLSLGTMKEPYTCRLCKHTFEKSSIVEYIKGPNRRGHTAKCPIPGCHVDAMTLKDLYLDEAMLRRMKRAAQAEREEQERSSEQEEDDDDVSVAAATAIKADSEVEVEDV
ncbi:E3 SUMO-protein ligase NSE2 [Cytospora mali]|uniref:E3 SUMO-protein ligase NSE2 n=1 Tax=Cytospora mali TaxID=578113 RepID=A0A194UMW4_CYTMA|nr:E3 SUMO-protein ligase NSE2 [Valsa mali var. pyri (nom. inval.)]